MSILIFIFNVIDEKFINIKRKINVVIHMPVEKNYTDWLLILRENKSTTKPNDMSGEIGEALRAIDKMYGLGSADRAMMQAEMPELGWKSFAELKDKK